MYVNCQCKSRVVGSAGETVENYHDSSYDSPFRFADKKDRILIVGAGAGNDAAAALRNGAKWIDTVEIDPLIYSQKYDVIIFALLDSHTEFSGYSNMRVDNYVYTVEALREASELLKSDDILGSP